MERKVYAVVNEGGEWDSSWTSIVGIYDNKETAIKVAENFYEELGNWKQRLPVPYNFYVDSLYDFEITTPNEDDIWSDDTILFRDHGGYSKEDWEITSSIIDEHEYDDYIWTMVKEYDLLSDVNDIHDNSSIEIWRKQVE